MDHAETFEYAIRKDVRNNPIVREVDERRQRELWSSLGIGVVLVLVVMFSAWQHFELIRHGYQARADAEGARRRGGRAPAPAARDRDAARAAAHREAGDRSAGHGRADQRRRHRARARARPTSRRPAPSSPRADADVPIEQPTRGRADPPPWRDTVRRRAAVAGVLPAGLDGGDRGAAGVPAGGAPRRPDGARRSPADAHGDGAGQARRDPRPPRPAARLQRRRRQRLRRAGRDRRRRRPPRRRCAGPSTTATRPAQGHGRALLDRAGLRVRRAVRHARRWRRGSPPSISRASAS